MSISYEQYERMLDEQYTAQCRECARRNGYTTQQADNCDDGNVGCRGCPFKQPQAARPEDEALVPVKLRRERDGLNGYDILVGGSKVGTIYYDRHIRSWSAWIVDETGMQRGPAEVWYTRDEALWALGFTTAAH